MAPAGSFWLGFSNEQEVNQRNQGRPDAGGYQGVIGAGVVLHVE